MAKTSTEETKQRAHSRPRLPKERKAKTGTRPSRRIHHGSRARFPWRQLQRCRLSSSTGASVYCLLHWDSLKTAQNPSSLLAKINHLLIFSRHNVFETFVLRSPGITVLSLLILWSFGMHASSAVFYVSMVSKVVGCLVSFLNGLQPLGPALKSMVDL